LKIFEMKTFGSKRLQRKPKRGSGNYVRTHALEVSSGCGASIENVFENFKSPNCGAGDLACVAWCACARKCARAAPIEVPLRRFRSPARLTGPIEGTFDRVCTTLLNRRRSTKVLFPNINDMKTMTAGKRAFRDTLGSAAPRLRTTVLYYTSNTILRSWGSTWFN